jgi:hypothetical protein
MAFISPRVGCVHAYLSGYASEVPDRHSQDKKRDRVDETGGKSQCRTVTDDVSTGMLRVNAIVPILA